MDRASEIGDCLCQALAERALTREERKGRQHGEECSSLMLQRNGIVQRLTQLRVQPRALTLNYR